MKLLSEKKDCDMEEIGKADHVNKNLAFPGVP